MDRYRKYLHMPNTKISQVQNIADNQTLDVSPKIGKHLNLCFYIRSSNSFVKLNLFILDAIPFLKLSFRCSVIAFTLRF